MGAHFEHFTIEMGLHFAVLLVMGQFFYFAMFYLFGLADFFVDVLHVTLLVVRISIYIIYIKLIEKNMVTNSFLYGIFYQACHIAFLQAVYTWVIYFKANKNILPLVCIFDIFFLLPLIALGFYKEIICPPSSLT